MNCKSGFPDFTISQNLLKLTSIESVMPYNYLILCCHLLLLSIFPSISNNQYPLKPEVVERPAEIEAYTDKDKFEKMVEERPYLRTLQTELKLEGDL